MCFEIETENYLEIKAFNVKRILKKIVKCNKFTKL